MRTALFLALAMTSAALSSFVTADDKKPQWSDYAAPPQATRSGGTVTVVIKGNGKWHVNCDYGPKVTVGATKQGKDDANCSYENDDRKAKKQAVSATFTINDAGTSGKAKSVFCDESTCSSPVETTFTVP